MEIWCSAPEDARLDTDGPVDVPFEVFRQDWVRRAVFSRFEEVAVEHGQKLAVTDGAAAYTYADILRRACALADRLQASTACGSPVGICLPHGATFPIAALACLACGRPYVPIDLKTPPARMRAIVAEAGMTAVIGDEASVPRELRNAPFAFLDFGKASKGIGCVRPIPSDVDDAAVILYTSGSTGKPKGICNSQSAILQRVSEYTNSCHLHTSDRMLLLSSPGTIAGVRETFAALLNGASLHIADPQQSSIGDVLGAFAKGRITVCYTVPALLRTMLRAPGAAAALSNLRVLRIGGDITLVSDFALFRDVAPATCHFFVSFSATECPAVFQWFVPAKWERRGTRIPVGHVRPGVEFAVIDRDGNAVRAGEIGDLVVKSRYVAMGQWQDGRLVHGPFRTDPDDPLTRIIHLGDLVCQRADGLWELIGRTDRQLKIRGQRVDLSEVEAILRSCAWVADTAVIIRRTEEAQCAIVAFVVLRIEDKDAFVTHSEILAEIRRMLESHAPQYARPTELRVIGQIPQLPGFKPDIQLLEALDQRALYASNLERQHRKEIEGPTMARTQDAKATESRARNAVKLSWSKVIGAQSFDPDRSWEDNDGDSLKAMELWFYLEDQLGFKVPMEMLGGSTTPRRLVADIADHIDRDGKAPGPVPHGALIFLMPGILGDDPVLARFRASFGSDIAFKTVDYPCAADMMEQHMAFEEIVDSVFQKIIAESSEEPYRLAGYSFGGVVAIEAARRLIGTGRRVNFLGIIDSRRWDLIGSERGLRFDATERSATARLSAVTKTAMNYAVEQGWIQLLRLTSSGLSRCSLRFGYKFERQLTRMLRFGAMHHYALRPLDLPTTLFLSDSRWPGEPHDYGWDGICRPLTKVHIGGDHNSILGPQFAGILNYQFSAAMAKSLSMDRPPLQ